ncbi:MAG: alpha/beta hydrolase [Patescibacteria group bacterium]|jgi:pimeloyl-ACP methyl ester carboxylesterase|nr:alpha/beta hydrolase [Patescibacteria group bacterium]
MTGFFIGKSFCYYKIMKTVLFVPSYMEDINSRDYKTLIKNLGGNGYKIIFVSINWKYKTIDDWIKNLDDEYNKHETANTILAGFSYGAMTAFMAATKRNPAELWLFSLSPYFKEDIESPKMRPAWLRLIGKKRVKAFSELVFNDLSNKIKCRTLIFAGQKEMDKYPGLNFRAKDAHKKIKESELFIAEYAGHDVAHPNYISTIIKAVSIS